MGGGKSQLVVMAGRRDCSGRLRGTFEEEWEDVNEEQRLAREK